MAHDRQPAFSLADLMAPYSHEVAELLLELRSEVRRLAPHAQERGYPGWRIVKYDDTVYLSTEHSGVHVGFLEGIHLPGPRGLLTGAAPQGMHLRLPSGYPVPREALPGMPDAAFEYDGRHGGGS